jgi:hypothetical protein
VHWYGPSLRPFSQSTIWALVIPTKLSVGVVDRDDQDEVVALDGRVLIPDAVLDWSTRGEFAGDPGSLDPSPNYVPVVNSEQFCVCNDLICSFYLLKCMLCA